MDVASLIGVASVAEAILFFVGGYATSRLSRPSEEAARADAAVEDVSELNRQLEQYRLRVQRLEQQVTENATRGQDRETLEAKVESLTQRLEASQRAERELQARLAEQQAAGRGSEEATAGRLDASRQLETNTQRLVENLKKELSSARSQIDELQRTARSHRTLEEQLRQRIAKLEREAAKTRQASSELSRAKGRITELEQELSRLRPKATKAERLADKIHTLEQELEQVRLATVPASDNERLTIQLRDLKINNQALRAKVDELQKHALDAERYRQSAEQVEHLTAERDELRARLRSLEAKAFAKGVDTAHEDRDEGNPDARSSFASRRPTDGQRDATMEQLMAEYISSHGVRHAIVSDTEGFPVAVASAGSYADPMSVAAGLVSEVGERLGDMLPFETMRSCDIVDTNRTHLYVQFFSHKQQTLALTMIYQGESSKVQDASTLAYDLVQVLDDAVEQVGT